MEGGEMKLPEVAARLRELAKELNCGELSILAAEIARRPAGSKAPRSSASMNDSLRQQIREMKDAEPHLFACRDWSTAQHQPRARIRDFERKAAMRLQSSHHHADRGLDAYFSPLACPYWVVRVDLSAGSAFAPWLA